MEGSCGTTNGEGCEALGQWSSSTFPSSSSFCFSLLQLISISISKKNHAKTRRIRSKTTNPFAPTSSPISKPAP
ncbi:hypothetical protein Cni_G07047 [Canna indica]|uniref:Uncharacterized protein n=1 Tax=Canna indica TaxID=4628 RepID=A0AAQ3K1F8_9LILI|nr:hypothetical protein Cni_G07047 [Canna indica]